MDWLKWVIPLIVVAVFILSNLSKKAPEEPKRPVRPPRRPDEFEQPPVATDATPRPRRKASEVERFLEEINRRRLEASQRRDPPPQPPPLPPVPAQANYPIPRPQPPVPVAREVPRPRPRPAERTVVRQSPPPVLREFVEAPVPVAIAVAPVLPATPPPVPVPRPTPEPPRQPKARLAAAEKLFDMLRSRDTLRTAFLLRELLDAPRCRRPR